MSTRWKRSRRWNHFRPLLETLESRWCPAVTMSVENEHILHVVGDRGDNQVEVTMQGVLATVTGDGVTQTFRGIDTVNINTWAGRDDVQIVALELPTGSDTLINADLGAGNDSFSLFCPSDPSTPPPDTDLQPRLDVAVLGGTGDDQVGIVADSRFIGDLEFTANLGAGNDAFALSCPSDPSLPPMPGGFTPCIDVAVHGGTGDDVLQTIVGSPGDLVGKRGELSTEFHVDLQGDTGNDALITNVTNVKLDGQLSLNEAGGLGNDSFRAAFGNVDISAPLSLSNDGGAGHDDIRVIFGIVTIENPQHDPLGVTVNAAVDVTLDGGFGSDNIAAICGFNPQPDPPAFPAFEVAGSFKLDVLGGGGSDLADLKVLNTDIGGLLGISADMGAGNDQLHVETTNINVVGALAFHVMLGGEDDLGAWANHDVSVSGTVAIDVDCGAGNDSMLGEMMPSVDGGGAYNLNISGGAGDDALAVSLFPTVQRGGAFRAVVDGGTGTDHLFGLVNPGPCEPSSLVAASFQGGTGNDQIAVVADLASFAPDSGRIVVGVNAGDGSDQIEFLVLGIERSTENASFFLDGGAGRDIALVSPLVVVQDVESIVYQ